MSKYIKKVVKFSFKQQKVFWVLVFSFIYLVLVDAMDKSLIINSGKPERYHADPSQLRGVITTKATKAAALVDF